MTTKLYHKDVYMPEKVKNLPYLEWIGLNWRSHALDELNDKNGTIQYFDTLKFCGNDIIEAEIKGTIVTKLVIRTSYDNKNDLITVIRMIKGKKTIITVWLNSVKDNHKTLDRSKYSTF